MNLLKSFYGLIKNNDGNFVSEKQASFLNSMVNEREGFIGHTMSTGGSPIFVKCDDVGIIEMYKHVKTKKGYVDTYLFQRTIPGELTAMQKLKLSKYQRKLKKLEKNLAERIESFDSGNYNGSGDKSTYGDYTIELYNQTTNKHIEAIEALKKIISEIEK